MTGESHGPGGGRGCVEAETKPKPHAKRARACSPRRSGSGATSTARLPGGFTEPLRTRRGLRSDPSWECCLQGGGREAGCAGRHFPGSFTLAGTNSRFPRGCARRSALPLPPLPASCLRLLPLPPHSIPVPVCLQLGSESSGCPSSGCGRRRSPRRFHPRWTAATPALRASGT